jgi:acyl-homoserine-lactone acylase
MRCTAGCQRGGSTRAGPGFAKRHAVPPAPGVHLGGGLASNGWAFGGEVTGNGRGLVLANPHFPWWGEGRLWECHLKIPGEIDVYGASLVGAPGVQIGTTASLAWTHTFSRGHRFALYSHELDPSEPTRYRFGEGWEDMVGTAVSVEYRDASGGVETVSVERFATRYGPVVNLPMIGWSPGFCTSYRDANLANTGFVNQAVATARCASVNEYVATLASFGAMPWATSNIADADGNSAFLDYSVTPKLSPSAEEKFRDSVLTNPLVAMALDLRVALFDGSDPDMSWLEVDGAPWPGTTPTSDLPLSRSGRGLFNSNDPAWLCGYEERIEGTPAMSGIDRRPISPRTRANGLIVGRAWPGGADQRWSPELAVAALCERGSLMAELLLDAVTDRCAADDQLAEAVSILRSWDRQYQLGSVGATLWREFLGGFTKEELNDAGRLWAEPFDPNRPFDTPRGLCDAPSGSTGTVDPASDPVCVQMHAAIAVLASAGVAIDAPLGDVQWVQRGERRIPVPGGCEVEGIADVLGPWGAMPRADIDPRGREGVPVPSRFERTGLSEGGYPCTYGVSFLMAAGFDERGPVGLCLTAYGQSADDRSEQYWDQTVAWARGEMRPIRFHAEDVAADTIRTISVDARRHRQQGESSAPTPSSACRSRWRRRRPNRVGLPLYRYVGGAKRARAAGADDEHRQRRRPRRQPIDIQEFMIMPVGAESFAEAVRWGAENLPRAEEGAEGRGPQHQCRRRRRLRAEPRRRPRPRSLRHEVDRAAGYKAGREIVISRSTRLDRVLQGRQVRL